MTAPSPIPNSHPRRLPRSVAILLHVTAGIALLALLAILLVRYVDWSPPPQINHGRRFEINNLKTALDMFMVDTGRYPTTDEGLVALITSPPDLKASWRGPYMEALLPDKWDHPFIYRCPGTTHPDGYDLFSAGADGIPDTDDDVSAFILYP